MNKRNIIEINSTENFEIAKNFLLDKSESATYSKTWSDTTGAKRDFYDLMPVFWLTPLADGVKELEECECDRFLRWSNPIAREYAQIKTLCRQQHPKGATLRFDIPIDLFKTDYNEDYRVFYWYNRLKEQTDIDFSWLPPPSPVGCIRYESKDGFFFNSNTLKYLYQYWRINHYTEKMLSNKNCRILEIGGGYGGFAFQILHRQRTTQYVIIDLPDTMILSIYFLKENFPNISMALHTDFDGHIDWDTHQVHFVTNDLAHRMHGAEFDLVVNSNSLLEMRREDIELYFNLIQNHNRVRHFYNYNMKTRVEGDTTYRFDEMPYDEHWQDLLYQEAVYNTSFFEIRNVPTMERLSQRIHGK